MRGELHQTGEEHPDTPPQAPYASIRRPVCVVYEDGQVCFRTLGIGDAWNYIGVALADRKEHFIDFRIEEDRRAPERKDRPLISPNQSAWGAGRPDGDRANQ